MGYSTNAHCIFPPFLGKGEGTIPIHQVQGRLAKELIEGKIYNDVFWLISLKETEISFTSFQRLIGISITP